MKRKNRLALLLPVGIALLIFGCNEPQDKTDTTETTGTTNEPINQQQKIKESTETTNTANEPVNNQSNKTSAKSLLVGDWIRTDADYRVQISELMTGGIMKAGYFNPKSINVGKAVWDSAGGVLRIYIELRDVNYPGSNYTLTYLPERDLLAGKYYQAVERLTYDVGFLRKK